MAGIYWLASYPKSGNTWLRAFLTNLLVDGDQPQDINELATDGIASGRGWLDEVLGFDTADLLPGEIEPLRPAVYDWTPRDEAEIGYYKIHDAFSLTRDGVPIIGQSATLGVLYIVRNPLDVAPSAANHWNCGLDDAIEKMGSQDAKMAALGEGLPNQVSQRLGSWSAHVLSWVDAPGLNCRVIRYEDMLAEPQHTFTQAAEFLQLPTEPERIAKAIRFSDFRELSRQEQERGFQERPRHAPSFFRAGKSGGWRELLTPAQVERIVTDHGAVMRRFGYSHN